MSPGNCWNLRVTAEVNQGGRKYMEDVTSVQFERVKSGKVVVEYAAFAIYDGHGGKDAAHFARDHLLNNIKLQKGFFSSDVEVVKKAISDAFVATHLSMWDELTEWPKTSMGHPSTAGTTASLMIIRGNRMYVANVGDSMIVMGSKDIPEKPGQSPNSYVAKDLTIDHKPELVTERKRIEECGGCVMNKSGVNRVVWSRPKLDHSGPIRRSTKLDQIPFLAVARSLGDLWSYNPELNEFVVSPVPDVYVYDLHKSKEQFVILASDGLWNMVRPQEAVKIVGDFEANKNKQQNSGGSPAHRLVQLALDRWKMKMMRADNTSVIVVIIERKKLETAKRKEVYFENWSSARNEPATVPEPDETWSTVKPEETWSAVKPEETDETWTNPVFKRSDTELISSLFQRNPVKRDDNNEVPVCSSSSEKEPLQDSSISSSSDDIEDDHHDQTVTNHVKGSHSDQHPSSSDTLDVHMTKSQPKNSPKTHVAKRRRTISDIPTEGVKTRKMSLRPARRAKSMAGKRIQTRVTCQKSKK